MTSDQLTVLEEKEDHPGGAGGTSGGGGGGRWAAGGALSFVLCVGYLCSFDDNVLYMFVVFPGHVLPPYCWIWSCFSHSFFEVHWWIVVWDVVVVLLQDRLLWSPRQRLAFYAVVNVFVGLMTALTYVALYLMTQDTYYLFDVHVNGLAGYIAAVSVALKKIMPDGVVLSLSSLKLQFGHLPLLLLVFSVLLRKVGIVGEAFPVMFFWGIVVSWIYLQIHKKILNWLCFRVCGKQSADSPNDNYDSFPLTSFLPQCSQSMWTVLSSRLYLVLLKCRRHGYKEKDSAHASSILVSLNGFETV